MHTAHSGMAGVAMPPCRFFYKRKASVLGRIAFTDPSFRSLFHEKCCHGFDHREPVIGKKVVGGITDTLERCASHCVNGPDQRLAVQWRRRIDVQRPGDTQHRFLGQCPCRTFQAEVRTSVQCLPQKCFAAGVAEPLGTVLQHLLNDSICRRVLPGDLGEPPDVAGHQQHRQGNQQVQPDLINGIQDRRLFDQCQAQDGTDNDKRNQNQWPPIGRLLFSDYARMMVPSACLSFVLIRYCVYNIFK